MKFSQIIILSLAVVLFIIGVHQTMLYGIANSYFIFMFTIAVLLYYYRKKLQLKEEENNDKNDTHQRD